MLEKNSAKERLNASVPTERWQTQFRPQGQGNDARRGAVNVIERGSGWGRQTIVGWVYKVATATSLEHSVRLRG